MIGLNSGSTGSTIGRVWHHALHREVEQERVVVGTANRCLHGDTVPATPARSYANGSFPGLAATAALIRGQVSGQRAYKFHSASTVSISKEGASSVPLPSH